MNNAAEDRRREQRAKELVKVARRAGRELSSRLVSGRRATPRPVKFIRWLRHALRENLTEADAVPSLASLSATL